MKLDSIAKEGHFVDHLASVWLALPPEIRGTFYVGQTAAKRCAGLPNVQRGEAPKSNVPTLVASSGDLYKARKLGRPVALMEHGCGQSFGGDKRSANSPSYAGGNGRHAQLFLHPGPHPAARDRERHPEARVEIIGCPRLDSLPRKSERSVPPVIAVSFHWDCRVSPETRSAAAYFASPVGRLAKEFKVIGHGHPRIMKVLTPWYARKGIEAVNTFDEVCARADVYVNDASSTLFEFASTGRPVVVLNPSIYRRNVNHGLRFWEAATVGVQVTSRENLADAVREALEDSPEQRAAREAALDLVYAFRSGGAMRAAVILEDWSRHL